MDYQQYVRDNEDAIRHKDSRIDACIDCEYFMPDSDCERAFCGNAKSKFHLMDIGQIARIDAEGNCVELNNTIKRTKKEANNGTK